MNRDLLLQLFFGWLFVCAVFLALWLGLLGIAHLVRKHLWRSR